MSLYLSPRARRVAVAVPLVGALLLAGCASSRSTGTAAAKCDPQKNSSKKFTIGISQWDLNPDPPIGFR